MIPGSSDGVNYYRLATWAFEMRKYRNVLVDLMWFKYEVDPKFPMHPWQRDFTSQAMSFDEPGMTVGKYIRACIDHACELADVVIWHPVHYDYTLDFFLEMQHKHQKPFIVETDDNFIDVPPWNEGFNSYAPGSSYRRIALDTMRNADAVTVTTPHLKYTYSQFNENIHIVENSLDFKGDRKFIGWDRASVRKHKGLRIGWIGGRTHYNDLMMVAEPLREILQKHPDVTLCLVNSALKRSCEELGRPYPFEGLKVQIADRSVAINRYAPFMASYGFDIGIAPLVDCNFNRGKSNLRWLEYSALKIPCVASNVGHFASTVRPGQDGLLVDGNDLGQWKALLEHLVTNPAHREVLGRNAYKRVKTDFNVRRNAAKYIRLLKQIANTSLPVEEPQALEVA